MWDQSGGKEFYYIKSIWYSKPHFIIQETSEIRWLVVFSRELLGEVLSQLQPIKKFVFYSFFWRLVSKLFPCFHRLEPNGPTMSCQFISKTYWKELMRNLKLRIQKHTWYPKMLFNIYCSFLYCIFSIGYICRNCRADRV